MMTYPLALKDNWYGDANYAAEGGRLVWVAPLEYLSAVKPLNSDDELARENIDYLKEHIKAGGELDPLVIYADGKEDGRHRAYAAIELDIETVPVVMFGLHLDSFAHRAPG